MLHSNNEGVQMKQTREVLISNAFIHSFSICYVPVRVAVNPEPIPGGVAVRWEYTLGANYFREGFVVSRNDRAETGHIFKAM